MAPEMPILMEMPILIKNLSELLQKGASLESCDVPEFRRSILINQLEISIRIANVINNMGVDTIWDLVRLRETDIIKYRNFNSRYLMA